ncbi:hypothetical protein [Escherichia coli]|nr:hypothetical protein [Escherichia coli]
MKVTRTDLHRCYSPISFTVIRNQQATGCRQNDFVIAKVAEGLAVLVVV